jgi:hypothetical protein
MQSLFFIEVYDSIKASGNWQLSVVIISYQFYFIFEPLKLDGDEGKF